MPSTWLGSDKYQFYVTGLTQPEFKRERFGFPDLPKREADALLIRPSHLVPYTWGDVMNVHDDDVV